MKTLKVLLFFIATLFSVCGWAYDFEKDGIYYNILSEKDKTVEVTHYGYGSYNGDITIPTKVNDYDVVRIGSEAFYMSAITSISISNSITEIGGGSFMNCTTLKSIFIPKNVKIIEENAFAGCTNLTSLDIENDEVEIETGAFCFCKKLSSFTIPRKTNKIAAQELSSTNIESITIPQNVKEIGFEAFYNCQSLKKVVMYDISIIENRVFEGCKNITDVYNYAETPQKIGDKVFSTYGTLHVLKGKKEAYMNAANWNKFTIVDDLEINEYVLNDGEVYDSQNMTVTQLMSYRRTFTNTEWQALYVPFSMSYSEWKDEFEVAEIDDIFILKAYIGVDWDQNPHTGDRIDVYIKKMESGSLEPNKPYFIRAKSTGDKVIKLKDIVLYPAEENSIDYSTNGIKFIMHGTYNGIDGSEMYHKQHLAMSNGILSYAANENASLRPMRWYIEHNAYIPTYDYDDSPFKVRVRTADDKPTAIDDAEINEQTDDCIYTIDGHKADASNLTKGIYVRKSKTHSSKFIVK
ncbi:MAG: leucine-rich repeat domain-containing protein [Bacteroidaceae bacterium]|nr:leucine-rich repeat domain-containing protein [Bacteroidaceae bacterium]